MNFEELTEDDFINAMRYVSEPYPKRVLLNVDTPHFVCRDPAMLPARYKALQLEVDGATVEVVIGTDAPKKALSA